MVPDMPQRRTASERAAVALSGHSTGALTLWTTDRGCPDAAPLGHLDFDLGADEGTRLERFEASREKILVARVVVADVGADRERDRLPREGLGRRRAAHPPAGLRAGALSDGLGLGAWAAWEDHEHALGEAARYSCSARSSRGRRRARAVSLRVASAAHSSWPRWSAASSTSIPWRSCRLRARENFTTVTARDEWATARRVSAASPAGR
jgi:hypothetical protein